MSALETEIERIVRRVLSEHTATPGTYDTRRLPPDVRTRVRFHAIVKEIPTATKRGRTWSVPREDWDAYRAGGGAGVADSDDPAAVAARMMAQSHRVSP